MREAPTLHEPTTSSSPPIIAPRPPNFPCTTTPGVIQNPSTQTSGAKLSPGGIYIRGPGAADRVGISDLCRLPHEHQAATRLETACSQNRPSGTLSVWRGVRARVCDSGIVVHFHVFFVAPPLIIRPVAYSKEAGVTPSRSLARSFPPHAQLIPLGGHLSHLFVDPNAAAQTLNHFRTFGLEPPSACGISKPE
ncbi:hypothetical protein VUR80DRAFT_7929 [Thermomyces stellatus]